MADPKPVLIKLTQNLNTLREREAKYGGNAPLELVNQIDDHEKAIDLTKQAMDGQLSQAEWREAMKPLLVAIDARSGEAASSVTIGDIQGGIIGSEIAGRDINIGQKINNFFFGSNDQRDQRNRQTMLKLVKEFWVKGVLENSLHNAVLLELGMVEKREAVVYPWEMVLQAPHQPNCTLAPGTKIIDIFDQHQTLLILGEPGAGKTTMLLELARQTIARAEADPAQPMPVVFNLSSWQPPKTKKSYKTIRPLDVWLAEELNSKYNIPRKIAQTWVNDDALLLLLDGLDEVAQSYRAACVEAINSFRKSSLMPVVVCSRVADYEGLSAKLNLSHAIVLQPFTHEQIDVYLVRFGAEFFGLKLALRRDPNLMELAQSPLLLNVMMLVYQGIPAEKLSQLNLPEVQRQRLFEVYVQRMFERRRMQSIYPTDKTCRWLTWLATIMMKHSQTLFLIERLQPDWLSSTQQKRVYQIANMLAVGLLFGLSSGLGGGLLYGLGNGLIGGLIFGLIFGMIFGLTFESEGGISPVETLKWSWQGLKIKKLIFQLIGGLIGGLIFLGLTGGLIFAMLGGLKDGLKRGKADVSVIPNQGIWSSLKNSLIFFVILFLIFGLIFGPKVGLIFGLIFGPILWMGNGGAAFIQHFCLRFVLYHNGAMPWNYARFLDYCADRIFLRKVGGGYIFIHRYLLEYFASLESEQKPEGRPNQ